MSDFLQLHLLTCYAPSNLNRDDLGRPKTAKMGGVDRLRISSQSLKRAWRTSELFQKALGSGSFQPFDDDEKRSDFISIRSRKFGEDWFIKEFQKNGLDDPIAQEWSIDVLSALGEVKKEKKKLLNELSQVVALSPAEVKELKSFIVSLSQALKKQASETDCTKIIELQEQAHDSTNKDKGKKAKELAKKIRLIVLKPEESAVDIALFGRMLASSPSYNVEAAAQVSHALTVNRVVVEDDYFTAVDDLNKHEEDAGSAHIGETGFGSGVFYTYVCVNRTLLVNNLGGDDELANRAIRALTKAASQIAPSGKQNSYASRAHAHYVMAEKGTQQPRQLSAAFLKPVDDEDMAAAAIERLESLRDNMDQVYGKCYSANCVINVVEPGEGKDEKTPFERLLEFVADWSQEQQTA